MDDSERAFGFDYIPFFPATTDTPDEENSVMGETERKHGMNAKNLKVVVWIGITFLYLSATAWSQNPMLAIKGQEKTTAEDTENVSLTEDLNTTQVDQIVAGLSDEQVRRLLIKELKLQAQQETDVEVKPGGVAGLIDKIKNLTSLLQTRIEYIRSGGRAAPHQARAIYTFLLRG